MDKYDLTTVIWKHKFPILLSGAGSALVVTQMLDLLILSVPTFFEKTWLGVGLGVIYILLAAAYEWVIRTHERTQERIQRKREMIEEMDFEEGQ